MDEPSRVVITPDALDELLEVLARRGFRVVAPVVRDGAILFEERDGDAPLPVGWTDRQEAGSYRLERRADEARFGFAVGPHSWKQFLFPARLRLWRARRDAADRLDFEVEPRDERPYAFVGVRSCDLHAIATQDRVFMGGRFVDDDYASRRENAFIVAVNCFEPGGTCFCVSMGTGPRVDAGYDLALTELLEGEHRVLVEVGTDRGADVLRELARRPAHAADLAAAERAVAGAAERMGRVLETADLPGLLTANPEHPRWEDVADRCLSCGNCVLVCPTCFCSTVEDHTDLAGAEAERWRTWDTCFSVDHSYIHGASVRAGTRSRYRQWLTHKLDTWHDQFGTSGCVGCGRCITWCPVAIDITAEVAAIRADGGADGATG